MPYGSTVNKPTVPPNETEQLVCECSLVRDLSVPSQVTVQGDAKVTLYLTGLDGTAVNLIARTDGLALPRNGLKLAFLIIEGMKKCV